MGLNSMVELGAWIIWTHRNGCVFEGLAPSMSQALMVSNDERCLWEMAGARGLSLLLADIGV
ncbi:hypothetical protein PR202_gb15871 [Eleusine coracana subsp. coracana]|uniref:Uncharacterized protein n=1 Tax=Eleusine coracana subsp. coracana TaxID=191504 RepID=A0AAV5EWP7_ELECO|nr:hypothetical protein PR202_gb15871 [Eleusine coracana subsp. coracana]